MDFNQQAAPTSSDASRPLLPKEVNAVLNTGKVTPSPTNGASAATASRPLRTPDQLWQSLLENEIRRSVKIELPPPCLSFDVNGKAYTVCTLGSFSLIIGKAKSGKTRLIEVIAAAAAGGEKTGPVTVRLPENQRTVIWFDTEQGKPYAFRMVERIGSIIGLPDGDDVPNFRAFDLRSETTADRLAEIQIALDRIENIGLVIIDGVRDLLTNGINDEAEATKIIELFMLWTASKGIHLITVLHQNKGNDFARGHIGTELSNKAETTIEVEKEADQKAVARVSPVTCRNEDFEPWGFAIDENGMPVFDGVTVDAIKGSSKTNPKNNPSDFPVETHREVLRAILGRNPSPSGKDIRLEIRAEWEGMGVHLSRDKAEDFWRHCKLKGLANSPENGRGKIEFTL